MSVDRVGNDKTRHVGHGKIPFIDIKQYQLCIQVSIYINNCY
jgi:hypothetical protein